MPRYATHARTHACAHARTHTHPYLPTFVISHPSDGGHSNSGGGGAAAKAAGKVKAEVEPDWVVEHAAKCSDAKKLKETEKHMERELRFKRMREDLTKRRAKAVVRVCVHTQQR